MPNFCGFSYKSPATTVEVHFLLLHCFKNRNNNYRANRAREVFMVITKLLLPQHPRKHLLQKILQAKLPNDYCLITLALFQMIEKNIDKCKLTPVVIKKYLRYLEDLKSYFLQELFTLYLAEESLFKEYIILVVRNGWNFNNVKLMSKLCASLTEETSSRSVFTFIKSLLLHEFNYIDSFEPSRLLLTPYLSNHLLNAFVPLSRFVHAPIELIWIFGLGKKDCHYNFNESENCIHDYNILLERKSDYSEVVSLKNLCRMSIRKYVFQIYTHHMALSILYSLDIPIELRQFLCYNYSNLKF